MLRSPCLTLAWQPSAALADIPRLLGDIGYRQQLTARIRDPILKGFWDLRELVRRRGFITVRLQNKMRAFLLRRFVRETFGSDLRYWLAT